MKFFGGLLKVKKEKCTIPKGEVSGRGGKKKGATAPPPGALQPARSLASASPLQARVFEQTDKPCPHANDFTQTCDWRLSEPRGEAAGTSPHRKLPHFADNAVPVTGVPLRGRHGAVTDSGKKKGGNQQSRTQKPGFCSLRSQSATL